MRRMLLLVSLCLGVVTAIYLWNVVGVSEGGADGAAPAPPLLVLPDPTTSDESPAQLARERPVEFLAHCLNKYREAGVQGYTCTFSMHERINGKMNTPDLIECWFQEKPFSVLMHWKEGAGRAAASLYVVGENEHMMCIRPAGKFEKFAVGATGGYVKRPVDGPEAKASSRYLITEFGVRCGTERTYKAWKALQDRGVTLQVEYLGIQNVKEAGGRDCHVVRRHCNPPEEEGLTEITIYVDVETWFQVGSVLKQNDDLIGSYWFTDIVKNPDFDDKQFKPETLKKY
jgi:hypothetical protein